MENKMMVMRRALREALGKVNEIYDILSKHCIVIEDARQACREARAVLIPALDKPPRNCDVGSANEQEQRFSEFCEMNMNPTGDCSNCPTYRYKTQCEFAWAQMPYEAEKGGAK